jgi:hypothetical protein
VADAAVGVEVLPGPRPQPERHKLKTRKRAAANCRMSSAWRLRKNAPRVVAAVGEDAEG